MSGSIQSDMYIYNKCSTFIITCIVVTVHPEQYINMPKC